MPLPRQSSYLLSRVFSAVPPTFKRAGSLPAVSVWQHNSAAAHLPARRPYAHIAEEHKPLSQEDMKSEIVRLIKSYEIVVQQQKSPADVQEYIAKEPADMAKQSRIIDCLVKNPQQISAFVLDFTKQKEAPVLESDQAANAYAIAVMQEQITKIVHALHDKYAESRAAQHYWLP